MKRQLWQLPVLTLSVLLATALVGSGKPTKDTKESTPNYYPLQVGNEWQFQLSVGDKKANMISRIAKIENIDGKSLARLEAEVNGQVVASEHLSQNEKGVFRHRNNGVEVDPPLCLLKYPVKIGDKWSGNLNVGKEKATYSCQTTEENVDVGAGKFKAIRVAVRLDSNGKIVDTSYWFVKDVGFVKQTVNADNLAIVMELQKFQIKKAGK